VKKRKKKAEGKGGRKKSRYKRRPVPENKGLRRAKETGRGVTARMEGPHKRMDGSRADERYHHMLIGQKEMGDEEFISCIMLDPKERVDERKRGVGYPRKERSWLSGGRCLQHHLFEKTVERVASKKERAPPRDPIDGKRSFGAVEKAHLREAASPRQGKKFH